MFSLKDITNFSNTQDYLPIFNAALITDLTVILMTILGYIKSKTLKEWYHKYEISAVIADVLSIFIGVTVARFIYSTFFTRTSGIFIFIVIAVAFQLCHDLFFAKLFNSIPRGKSGILDTFKDYAKEIGSTILLADATMIVSTIVIGSILANFDTNTNIIISSVLIYLTPYLLYSL